MTARAATVVGAEPADAGGPPRDAGPGRDVKPPADPAAPAFPPANPNPGHALGDFWDQGIKGLLAEHPAADFLRGDDAHEESHTPWAALLLAAGVGYFRLKNQDRAPTRAITTARTVPDMPPRRRSRDRKEGEATDHPSSSSR